MPKRTPHLLQLDTSTGVGLQGWMPPPAGRTRLLGRFFAVALMPAAMSTGPAPRPSSRALRLDPPYIENVLNEFADIADTANLAMGVSHWGPPPNALRAIAELGGTGSAAVASPPRAGRMHDHLTTCGLAPLQGRLR
jgi:hypothetical protein